MWGVVDLTFGKINEQKGEEICKNPCLGKGQHIYEGECVHQKWGGKEVKIESTK